MRISRFVSTVCHDGISSDTNPFRNVPFEYWQNKQHQRDFLDWLSKHLKLKHLDDWYNVRLDDILRNGGARAISKYSASLPKMLQTLYPEHKWLIWRFQTVPVGFWSNVKNQHAFMDWLGKQLGFTTLDDWYRVREDSIIQHCGSTMLKKFSYTPSKMVKGMYPQHEWIEWKFRKVPKRYWEDFQEDNIPKLIEWLSKELRLRKLEDWYRVSYKQIQDIINLGIFQRFPLERMLQDSYPNHSWDMGKLQFKKGTMKASQRVLETIIQNLFPGSEVKENYLHEDLRSEISGMKLELDIYLPKENLAFEYQGEHHYYDIYALGHRWFQKRRDEEKRKLCQAKGITLIEVPYWWDFKESSLTATIHQHRRDLFEKPGNGSPIAKEPPGGIINTGTSELMHGEEWDGKKDLEGWWMSEKLDGVRAYWNGSKIISRHAKDISCPLWFTEDLPQDVTFDGELWIARNKLENLVSALQSIKNPVWKTINYVLFDLPSSKEAYESRIDHLRRILLPSHVSVIGVQLCHGNNHLLKSLNQIVEQGGEGLMLNQPQSLYVGQRTESLLKVKLQDDCEVLLLEILPTGLYCLQTNGVESVLGCHREVIEDPPPIGSVLTVKYSGFYQNGTLRHAYFWRQRKNASWIDICKETRTLEPCANWTKKQNITEFFDSLKKKIIFFSMEDFYKLSTDVVRHYGGKALLDVLFEGSLAKALQASYPQHSWKLWRFGTVPNAYWDNSANQKEFLDWLSKQLKFKTMDDWYNISYKEILNRAPGILTNFDSSPPKLLQSVYPNHQWTTWKFRRVPHGYWDKKDNQREFMDWLSSELGMRSLEDWYQVNIQEMIKKGGNRVLSVYGGSLSSLLVSVYPHHPWIHEKVPTKYWVK